MPMHSVTRTGASDSAEEETVASNPAQSGVAVRRRESPVGSTTLVQKTALVESLRRIAVRSDRPGPLADPEAQSTAPQEEPTAPTLSPRRRDESNVRAASEPARPLPLVHRKPPRDLALHEGARPAISAHEGEPITDALPPARRARARSQERARTRNVRRQLGIGLALAVAAIVTGVAAHAAGSARARASATVLERR
jgi:hypothetical protein